MCLVLETQFMPVGCRVWSLSHVSRRRTPPPEKREKVRDERSKGCSQGTGECRRQMPVMEVVSFSYDECDVTELLA